MDRILTIIGSSTRAAAMSAAAAGFQVRAGDLFADADLYRSANVVPVADYPAGLAAVVHGSHAGPWMYTGALENHPALIDALARARSLWGNSGSVLRRVRDPQRVRRVLTAHAVPSPAVADDPSDIPTDGSWLAKPRRSAGGMRVAFWTAAVPLETRDFYLQEHVRGEPCSAVYVAARGQASLLGVTRQLIGQAWTGVDGFRYCGSIGPLNLPHDRWQQWRRIGEVLASEFELTGLFGVDAVDNAAGIWPVEVNPRYTASVEVLERSTKVSAIGLHSAACEHDQLPESIQHATTVIVGKAIVFAPARVHISAVWSARMLAASCGPCPIYADVPRGDTTIESGWPLVSVFAEAGDARTVVENLKRLAADVLSDAQRLL